MSGFTTAMPSTLKAEMASGIQNFSVGGDQFKCALGIAAPAGTYDDTTMNYSQLAAADELPNGSGYTVGGFAFTSAQNLTPQLGANPGSPPPQQVAYWQWSVNPQWLGLTASTSGCLIYNATKANRAAYVGSFGGVQVVAGATLTLILPVNAPGTALLSLI